MYEVHSEGAERPEGSSGGRAYLLSSCDSSKTSGENRVGAHQVVAILCMRT